MAGRAHAFDAGLPAWNTGQDTPWGRLRYCLAFANLQRHLEPRPLRILDAGGGNGLDALPLAHQGHTVTLVDFSDAMLADARRLAEEQGVADRLSTVAADVLALTTVVAAGSFDVVLCHNVLQYGDDVGALLHAVTGPLRPNGILSLMSTNRYAETYRAAFQHDDLTAAVAKLDSRDDVAAPFGVIIRRFAGDELQPPLQAVGCTVIGHYGVRCVCDYLPDNARKADPAYYAQLEHLEYALSATYPYYLLARFFQLVARKTDALPA